MNRPSQDITINVGENDDEVTATMVMTSPGCAARTYGRPEDCYPAEAAEFEVESWTLNGEQATEAEIAAAAGKPINAVLDDLHDAADRADWSDEPDPDYWRDMRMGDELMGCGE
jgi:hypothetical protein